ncbi:hypothetical protein [Nakamurella sp.]|uniref:hypothetical protein n=1 Tax=Nakamurella sp. TaxID=1869182 RepID=UPI003783D568
MSTPMSADCMRSMPATAREFPVAVRHPGPAHGGPDRRFPSEARPGALEIR